MRVAFQGHSYLVDAESGSFAFSNLPAGRAYTLTACENNSHRAQSRTVTIGGDDDIAVAQIVLRGVGTVAGNGLRHRGATPLPGALVKIRAGALASASYATYTDRNGHYHGFTTCRPAASP